jgi:hypothetical protein
LHYWFLFSNRRESAVLDADTHVHGPRAWSKDEPRVVVSMKTYGCELLLFFDDLGRDGPLRELRLLPDSAELEPRVLSQFAPKGPLYLQYARATMTDDDDNWRGSLEALREVGTTSRGLGDEFYRRIARQYAAIVAEGEPHPIKALGKMNHVVISTASRWVKEARRRNHIREERDDG